jgi:hypothetical protein
VTVQRLARCPSAAEASAIRAVDDKRVHGPSALLVAIKAVHSAAFLAVLSAILWLLATGIIGRRDRSVAVAAAVVAAEAALFVANDGVCPLTPLAERHGASTGGVSDIFLPDPIARTIPIWSTTLIAVAAALHARYLARRVQADGISQR